MVRDRRSEYVSRARVSKLCLNYRAIFSGIFEDAPHEPGMRASHGKMARGICERLSVSLVWMVVESRGTIRAVRASRASESSSRLVSEKRKQKASRERSRVIKCTLIEIKSDLKQPAGIRKTANNRAVKPSPAVITEQ